MTILQIEHGVRDFDGWKQAFDGDPVGRQQGGVRRYRIMRSVDDPNHVMIDLEFDDHDRADAFRTRLLALWDRAGDNLGLKDPQTRIVEAVETHEY